MSSGLFETVVTFATAVGMVFLALGAWLQHRRAQATAIRGGSNIPSSNWIWTPKVIALSFVGGAVLFLYMGSFSSFLKHDTRHAIWLLGACVALTIVFFRHRKIALAVIVLSIVCSWSYLIAVVKPTVLGWILTLSSGALLLAMAIWMTARYPDMKRRDFRKFFDRDPD
jgi:hypothetical protein